MKLRVLLSSLALLAAALPASAKELRIGGTGSMTEPLRKLAPVSAERPYDLLLTDVVPGISGRKLADEVTALRPGTAVPFMSGYSRDDIIHDGRIDADARLLTKPFHKRDLARAVRDALDSARH